MDEVIIKYGNSNLKLKKSEKFIAVKARPGIDRRVLSDIAPEFSASGSTPSTLGGFQLINVEAGEEAMEEALDKLRAAPAIVAGTHVFHSSDDGVPFVPTGQLYVEFKSEASLQACQKLLEQQHLLIIEARGERELIVQVTKDSVNPLKTAYALQNSPLVAIAEPDLATPGKIQSFALPADHRIHEQWHLQNTGRHRGTSIGFSAGADAHVIEAWELGQTLGARDIIVAVIDDGFDLSHADLSGDWKIVAPKDFTRNSAKPLPDPLQGDWHGTACAGVAIGNAEGTGIVGAAPHCRFMPIRWGKDLSDREIENWFGYAREQGAGVISCSWAAAAPNFPLSTRASRAIAKCANEGRNGLGTVICFAAANNNLNINDPASGSVNGFAIHPEVIAVAASNSMDQKSHYSNYGAEISVCAPSSGAGGWGITTSDVIGEYVRDGQTFPAGYSPGAYTDDFGGTSSACPLVAGICALLLSIKPNLTAKEVKQLLEKTARRIGDPSSYDHREHSIYFGYGCVNAAAAVADLLKIELKIVPAWGEKGHRTTNTIAIGAIPDDALRGFYNVHYKYLDEHAMDADKAKRNDPAEHPRHFINIDFYGEPPFSELPEDYENAVAKFGKETVIARGVLPWKIADSYNELVKAFRERRGVEVIKHSAWLGHYVGDAHVPLHTSANFNGQLTGQKGLHSYFETTLLNQHIFPYEIKPAMGKQIGQKLPHTLAFEWVRESFTFIQPILDADAANGGKTGKRNLEKFAKIAKPLAIDRLEKGCSRLASLWYSAWLEAGKPDLETIKL
jgi:subtilisin family serine protease